jgi:hypothetical protein
MWWSTDGAHLAYLKFNETLVPEFPLPIYNGDPYPKIESLAYPKVRPDQLQPHAHTRNLLRLTAARAGGRQPGYPNPQVTVSVYNVANASTTDLDWSESGSYEYVTGVWWVDAAVVAVRRLSRLQNVRMSALPLLSALCVRSREDLTPNVSQEEQTVLFNVVDGSSRVLLTKTSKAWIETVRSSLQELSWHD